MKYKFIPSHDRVTDRVQVANLQSDKLYYELDEDFHFVTGRIYLITTDDDKGTATVVEVFE